MAELGKRTLSTIMDEQPDEAIFPSLYLDGPDAAVVPSDVEVGEEHMAVVKVRLTSLSFSKTGNRSAVLEVLDMTFEPKPQAGPEKKLYPTMGD